MVLPVTRPPPGANSKAAGLVMTRLQGTRDDSLQGARDGASETCRGLIISHYVWPWIVVCCACISWGQI